MMNGGKKRRLTSRAVFRVSVAFLYSIQVLTSALILQRTIDRLSWIPENEFTLLSTVLSLG